MAISITHSKVLAAPDSGAADKVYGVDWNSSASHTLTGWSTVKMSTIRTTTTTSTAAITELAFTVSNTIASFFEFGIVYASDISTNGIRLGLTAPATSSLAATVNIPHGTGTAVPQLMAFGNISTTGDSVVTSTTPVASTKYFAIMYGSIVPSANGTLQLTYATETAGRAISTFAGSYGKLVTP